MVVDESQHSTMGERLTGMWFSPVSHPFGVSSALFVGLSVDVATPHGADASFYGASDARPTGVPAPVGMPRLLGGVL